MYDFKNIEKKWQKYWEDNNTYKFNKDNIDKKLYTLEMFSYPSGARLHLGHWYNYGPSDTYARFKRMQGYEVFHPMGFDAFGLPAENYAIKTGIHPKDSTLKNIETMEEQLRGIGATYDWDYEVITCNPDYYKWTQWLFLKLYEKGLAYKKEAPVNWCPSCSTVLANEQVISGNCERCGTGVIRKKLSQWFFKITNYAEELLNDLDKLDWPEKTKIMQQNWIGRSEGAMVKFKVDNSDFSFEVFTTRVDTLYGCTYCVLAPENELVEKIVTDEYKEKVKKYQEESAKVSDIDRVATTREKTGVFTGAYAINPINNKKVPIWISDYVIASYGTGAVMAVPAHDERDYEFAKKFNLEIIQVVAMEYLDKDNPPRKDKEDTTRKVSLAILKHWKEDKYAVQVYKTQPWKGFIMGGVEEGETPEEAIKREVMEEGGYLNIKKVTPIDFRHFDSFYAAHKGVNRVAEHFDFIVELEDDKYEEPTEEERATYDIEWIDKDKVRDYINLEAHRIVWDKYVSGGDAFVDYGIAINSEEFNGLTTEETKKGIVNKLKGTANGDFVVNYRLRDWLVSRQRYWGAPIPIIYCDKCGVVPVPEKDLPVELPYNVDFKPDGKSPLVKCDEFVNTVCPICGGPAKREVDTLDTFVCSSWYFLRYPDAKNDTNPWDKDLINKILPVDKYIGGVEHACLHLLYSRFITKALRDMGYIDFDEPFKSLVHQGMILGEDGEKMSKSKGNTVSPDDYIEKYGSDVFRTYLMFGFKYIEGGPWDGNGVKAISKFYERLRRLIDNSIELIKKDYKTDINKDKEIESIMHNSIREITKDLDEFSFNTAISRIMEIVNALYKYTYDDKINTILLSDLIEGTILLISPFAPHMAEELWQQIGKENSIFKFPYPVYDETKVIKDSFELVIQVNGKVRSRVTINSDLSDEEVKKVALGQDNVKKYLQGEEIVKTIVIPKKLVNIVVK
ncbi:MAG: leucine--tRNA ligase [Bacilli bacterium]